MADRLVRRPRSSNPELVRSAVKAVKGRVLDFGVDAEPVDEDIEQLLDELQQYLVIDKHRLDDESAEYSQLFWRISEHLEMETSRRDVAELAVEEIEAEVALNLRRSAANQETRITDKTVEAEVIVHARVKEAKRRHLKHKENVGKLRAMEKAFEKRSYQITNLKDLWINEYYGDARGDAARNRMTAEAVRDAHHQNRLRRQRASQ